MRRGLTLAELLVVLAILAIVTAVTLPRLAGLRDWLAVNTAAQEVTAAVAVARHSAVMQGTRARVLIAADSLRIDRWVGDSWGSVHRWPCPTQWSCSTPSASDGARRTRRSCCAGARGSRRSLCRASGGSSGGSGACNPFPGMGIKWDGAVTPAWEGA